MRILGIDPGTRLVGVCILDVSERGEHLVIAITIKLSARQPVNVRLACLDNQLTELIQQYQPDELAIEDQYVGVNPRGCLKLAGSKHVAILSATRAKMPVSEYAPCTVKKAVTGQGGADKSFVALCVYSMLHVQQESFKYYDTTDAIAVAFCHAHQVQARKVLAAGG